MKIKLNEQPIDIELPLTPHQLLIQLERADTGIAIAVNQTIIPRTEWKRYLITENDDVLLFQAIAGG